MRADEHSRFEELAAGHALNALEPHDEQVFLEHLQSCLGCQADIVGHQEALAALSLALPIATGPRAAEGSAPVLPILRPAVERRERRRPAASWLLAAAASVAAVLLAVSTLTMRGTVQDTRSELASVRAVIDCVPPRCTASWLVSPDGSRHAVVLHEGARAVLVVDGLPRNDRARTSYVLWQQDRGGRLNAYHGFDVDSADVSMVRLPRLARPYRGFAISRETGRTLPRAPSRALLVPTPS